MGIDFYKKPVVKWCLVFVLALVMGAFFLANVQAGVTLTVTDPSGAPQTSYKWLIEEDLTYRQDPAGGFLTPAAAKPVALGLNFHKSYFPVVASGDTALDQFPSAAALEGGKWYFVSVLPSDASSDPGHTLGGASFMTDGTGTAGPIVVNVNELPLPTAQIRVFVFEDTQPINGAPDLPAELGLQGFQITLEEPCGRYGACGGQVSQDAFGQPLCGTGVCQTDENGVVTIKNLAPGKYGLIINPPVGGGWMQTTTIEGSPVIDAWVKANEPPFFTEFGPPGPHVFVGFVREFVDNNVLTGGVTLQGQIVSTHNSRPPDYTFYRGAVFPDAIVGLNDLSQGANGVGVYVARTFGDSEFAIPNVPPGTYQLAIFDDNLDIVFAAQRVTVNADGSCATVDGSCNLGKVSVFSWFALMQGNVYYDGNGDGFKGPGEEFLGSAAASAVNIRWRDGTVYDTGGSAAGPGNYGFNEIFPFFAWLVAEVDFGPPFQKVTGVTVLPDAGGPVLPGDGIDPVAQAHSEYVWPSYGVMTPQGQGGDVNAPDYFWTEPGEVLTLGFQAFLGQTNVIHWGKKEYCAADADNDPQGNFPSAEDFDCNEDGLLDPTAENGGISGMVFYKVSRAEPNPEDNVGFPFEPGVPRVQVNLYEDNLDNVTLQPGPDGQIDDINLVAGIQPADVDNYPFDWYCQGEPCPGGTPGPEDVDDGFTGIDIALGNGVFDLGDAIEVTWTDSWDDNLPDGCPGDPTDPFFDLDGVPGGDCYDGLRNFNQVRPGVFDGGYAFGGYSQADGTGLVAGTYIVEAVPPPHYELVSAEDMNVAFGDTFTPSLLAFPFVPPCVGVTYNVPATLSLFPGEPHPYYDPTSPIYKGPGPHQLNQCDRKQVILANFANAAADFDIFTEVPVSARIRGFILNDLANEFDPNNPNFGEKFALPFVPVSVRDYNGVEITRVYSDQYGSYNILVPSTYTANLPLPSGMGPNMLQTCMNDPGPIPDPANPGQFITDPQFKPQYTQFCYTFQYMPGVTTYLDTPIEPIAAFAGQNQFPLDCEFGDRTPVIKTVIGSGVDTLGNPIAGPYVPAGGGVLTITSMGMTDVPNPAYDPRPGLNQNNAVTIQRDYGFGMQGAGSSVTINGIPQTINSWNNNEITVQVANGGQLMVTRANGLSTVMGVTVTVGGPVHQVINPAGAGGVVRWPNRPIQAAIDAAAPGDLVLVEEGTYEELVIMWQPVQLQGAGAWSTTINAVKAPGEKLQAWRDDIQAKVTSGQTDILPGQEIAFAAIGEPDFLTTHEGTGIIVLGKSTGPNRFRRHLSRIDGFKVTGGDIGGGIFVNAYAENLRISNNRVSSNAGIESGGLTIGPQFTNAGAEDAQNDNITIAYNHITQNGGRFGGAGGGVTVYTGAENYAISDCYICGNFSSGSGGGIGHQGLSNGGRIADNTIIFNQTFVQTPGTGSSGGGISIAGFPPAAPGALTDGAGSVRIARNLLQANQSGVGDGGAIMLKQVNGADVAGGRNNPDRWYKVDIVNNMIVNNMAADAGGGIAMQDAARVDILHNTIAHNDSTATEGDLINVATGASLPQPAGVVSRAHSPELAAAFGNANRVQPYKVFSNPRMVNNIVWENRSFSWGIDAVGNGELVLQDSSWDLAVLPAGTGTLICASCIVSQNADPAPSFVASYFNGAGGQAVIPENTTPLTSAAVDEGGNFIDVRFGPLTLWCAATGVPNPNITCNAIGDLISDYHITAAQTGQNIVGEVPVDFDTEARPQGAGPDIGADEINN